MTAVSEGPSATAVPDHLRDLVTPILGDLGLDLFDIEHSGGVLRVTVDKAGGVDLEAIAETTRRLSRALDIDDPIPGRYTLEVTSPGVERSLRTPAHFAWALGKLITVKTKASAATVGDRRVTGTLLSADDDPGGGFEVFVGDGPGSTRGFEYSAIEKARTVFEWGPAPKPTGKRRGNNAPARAMTDNGRSPRGHIP